jgi:hypothetical protein
MSFVVDVWSQAPLAIAICGTAERQLANETTDATSVRRRSTRPLVTSTNAIPFWSATMTVDPSGDHSTAWPA